MGSLLSCSKEPPLLEWTIYPKFVSWMIQLKVSACRDSELFPLFIFFSFLSYCDLGWQSCDRHLLHIWHLRDLCIAAFWKNSVFNMLRDMSKLNSQYYLWIKCSSRGNAAFRETFALSAVEHIAIIVQWNFLRWFWMWLVVCRLSLL